MTDKVNHPGHYNVGEIEVFDALRMLKPEEFKGFMKANAIKYIGRCEYKGTPIEDIDKAIFYLERLKDRIKKEIEGE